MDSRAKKRWQPVQSTSNKAIDYDVVYATLASAEYFGARKISYYSVPRVRIRMSLKRAKSGYPRQMFNIALGKRFLLTMRLGGGERLESQPAIVTAYSFNREKQYYSNVELELTNWINPIGA